MVTGGLAAFSAVAGHGPAVTLRLYQATALREKPGLC